MTTLRLIFSKFIFISFCFAISCQSPTDNGDSKNSQDQEKLYSVLDAIETLDRFQLEIDRGLLLNGMRAKEKNEIEDLLYWAKVALHRLKKDTENQEAGQLLVDSIENLARSKVVVTDYQKLMDLVNFLRDGVVQTLKVRYFKVVFQEDFADKQSLGFFTSYSVKGEVSFDTNNNYGSAKISSFRSNEEVDTWLLSPVLRVDSLESATLQIRQKVGHIKSWNGLDVLISRDYRGDDPTTATWDLIDIKEKPELPDSGFAARTSEDISLEGYANDQVVLAFRYQQGTKNQPTWEIEFVELKGVEVKEFKTIGLTFTDSGTLSGDDDSIDNQPKTDDKSIPDDKVGSGMTAFLDNTDAIFYTLFDQTTVEDHGFQLFDFKGSKTWRPRKNNKTTLPEGLNMSGFNDDDGNDDWLVSPEIDLSTAKNPSLQIAETVGFFTSFEHMRVLVSKDFAGDVKTATWTMLNLHKADLQNVKTGFSEAGASEVVSLAEFKGEKVFVAFNYISESPKPAINWTVREILIFEGE